MKCVRERDGCGTRSQVCNAGVCMTGRLEHCSVQDYKDQMDVNYFGAVQMTKAFLPALKLSGRQDRKPALVFVSRNGGQGQGAVGQSPTAAAPVTQVNSFGGRLALANMSAYTASKFALAGFADSIRGELAQDGIHVAQVQPGVIKSNFMERAQWRGPGGDSGRKNLETAFSSNLPG